MYLTLTEFNKLQSEFAYSNHEKWAAFRKCLTADVKTTWAKILDENYKDQNLRTTDEFKTALDKFITKLLNCDYSRDVQFRYMQPGGIGDRKCVKDMFMSESRHARRWKEVLRLSLMLPKGRMSDPTPELLKEWFYMSHYKEHRTAFLAAGKMLENSSMEELIEYFRLQQEKDYADGTLSKILQSLFKRKERRNKKRVHNDSKYAHSAKKR